MKVSLIDWSEIHTCRTCHLESVVDGDGTLARHVAPLGYQPWWVYYAICPTLGCGSPLYLEESTVPDPVKHRAREIGDNIPFILVDGDGEG